MDSILGKTFQDLQILCFTKMSCVLSSYFVSQMPASLPTILTQVMIEKKENAMTARAASPATAVDRVLDHWLARTQKQMNHRNVQATAHHRIKAEKYTQMKHDSSIYLNLVTLLVFGYISFYAGMSRQQWNLTLTWEDQISYNYVFSLLGVADLWEEGVQYEEDNTSQEGQDTDSHPVAAGAVVFIKHAFDLLLGCRVNIALCCDGRKDHNGKNLQWRETKG